MIPQKGVYQNKKHSVMKKNHLKGLSCTSIFLFKKKTKLSASLALFFGMYAPPTAKTGYHPLWLRVGEGVRWEVYDMLGIPTLDWVDKK